MNYIQTLYISPSQDPFKDSFGWISPIYHLLSWGLSAMSLKDSLGSLCLYTNKKGKDILVDMLKLPYDKVYLSFEDWELPHKDLWALSKIYTYSIQDEPFIHIDGDIYMFKKFDDSFNSAQLVAQNKEQFTDYYYSVMRPINRKFTYMPECVKTDFAHQEQLRAVNAGILGGNNIGFFKAYTNEAVKYVKANLPSLKYLDANRFNVFFEQHLFYKMADACKIEIKYLLNQEYHDNAYLGLDKFHEIPSKKSWYFHLLGNYKKDIFTCQQMAKTLLALYPQTYYRIIDIFNSYNQSAKAKTLSYEKASTNIRHVEGLLEKSSFVHLSKEKKESYQHFLDDIINCNKILRPTQSVLKKRDEQSFYWYHRIFSDEKAQKNIFIKRTDCIKILRSNFDWCRLYKKKQSSGIKYYSSFSFDQLTEGNYAYVFIPERFCGFSLYDIDEVELAILEEIEKPISIEDLGKRLIKYISGEIDTNFMNKFQRLIYNSLKRLILMKIVMPYDKQQ